jgi:hypothetical protein
MYFLIPEKDDEKDKKQQKVNNWNNSVIYCCTENKNIKLQKKLSWVIFENCLDKKTTRSCQFKTSKKSKESNCELFKRSWKNSNNFNIRK